MNKEQKITKFAKELKVLYEVFNWKWQDNSEPPTAEEIEKTIYMLLHDMEKDNYKNASTGGIFIEETDFGFEIEWCLTKSIYIDEQD